MAIYHLQDIDSTLSGDLKVGSNGDIELAASPETVSNAVNFWLRTDHADYPAASNVGANLGEFIGQPISKSLLAEVEESTRSSLTENIVAPEDLELHAVPFTHEEILISIRVGGDYLDEDGGVLQTEKQTFNYIFPYIDSTVYPA